MSLFLRRRHNNTNMKLSCAMLVPALVVALTFVTTSHCDEGFIDDFFSRFPHLPFHQVHPESGDPGNDAYYKTLYTMHKNRRGPGKTESSEVEFRI